MVNNKQFLHGSVSRYKHGLTWRRLTVQSLFPQCRLLECTQLPCLHKSAAASPWNNARHSIWKIVSQYFHIFLWRVQKELSLAFSKDFFWARIVFLLPTRQFVCISCETLPLVTSPELGVLSKKGWLSARVLWALICKQAPSSSWVINIPITYSHFSCHWQKPYVEFSQQKTAVKLFDFNLNVKIHG